MVLYRQPVTAELSAVYLLIMNERFKDSLKLLPVQTAPLFAAGLLLCSGGGASAVIFTILAAALAGAAFLLWRKGLAAAIALLCGTTLMTLYITLICAPVAEYSDTQQRLECRIISRRDYSGYSLFHADTNINGLPTRISFFSSEDWYEDDRLTADIYLTEYKGSKSPAREVILKGSIEEVISLDRPDFSILRSVSDYRRYLTSLMNEIEDKEASALAKGLLFGDTSEFSLELRIHSKISGIMHFTAVSGSHFVIIMTVLLYMISEKYKKLRAVISVICIPIGIIFFGADPTVLRSGIMLFLCHCGPLFAREADTLNSLCVSVLLMTIFSPYIILDVGFQMSVLGVFGAAIVGNYTSAMAETYTWRLPKPIKLTIRYIIISACAVICIAPVSVGIFGGISLVGVFCTVVLTPVFTAVLALGILLALTGLTALIIPLGATVKLGYVIITLFGSDSRAYLPLDFDGAGLFALIAACALILAVVAPKRFLYFGMCSFGISCTAAVVTSLLITGSQRKIEFTSDRSNGAAVIITGRESAVLISGSGEDITAPIADILLNNGVDTVRFIAAPQLGSAGAIQLRSLAAFFPTYEVISTEPSTSLLPSEIKVTNDIVEMIEADGITIAAAKAGDDDVTADVVIYHSYKKSVPENAAGWLALYASSKQVMLPENGINISETEFEINLR